MAGVKRHLCTRTSSRTACGLPTAPKLTIDPSQVTCSGCQRSIKFDVAVIKAANPFKV